MLKTALLLITLGLGVMWLTSYTHYTSIGIDRDQLININDDNQIQHTYYRIRWSGNGSIWIGGGRSFRAQSTKHFEPFDLAATFLYPSTSTSPERPKIKSAYNKIGFWRIKQSQPSQHFWLGIPAWLPVLFLGLIVFLMKKKKQYGISLINKS